MGWGRGRKEKTAPAQSSSGYSTPGQIEDQKKRKAAEEREHRQLKRNRDLFTPEKVNGPNDVFVDTTVGEIKFEESIVKQETEDVSKSPPGNVETHSFRQIVGEHEDGTTPFIAPEDIKLETEEHVKLEVIDSDEDFIDDNDENDADVILDPSLVVDNAASSATSQSSQDNTAMFQEEIDQLQQEVQKLKTENDEFRKEKDKLQEENDKLKREKDVQKLWGKCVDALFYKRDLLRLEIENSGLKSKIADFESTLNCTNKFSENKTLPQSENVQKPKQQLQKPVIKNKGSLTGTASSSEVSKFKKVFSSVFAFLNLKDIFNCRKVCVELRDCVNVFIDAQFLQNPFSKDVFQQTRPKNIQDIADVNKKYIFSDKQSIDNFLVKFGTSETNPILGRSVTFKISAHTRAKNETDFIWKNISERAASNELKYKPLLQIIETKNEELCERLEIFTKPYYDSVIKLLCYFGSHIWHVQIAQYELGLTPVRLYKTLYDCLPYLPNMKSLVVDGATHPCQHFIDQKYFEETKKNMTPEEISAAKLKNIETVDKARMQNLTAYMEHKPILPKLKKLESLEFLIKDGITRDIQDAIIAECVDGKDQLLRFGTSVFSTVSFIQLPKGKVREVRIFDDHSTEYYHLEQIVRGTHPGGYESIMFLMEWELEKLYLKINEPHITLILAMLCNFPTIASLYLEGTVIFSGPFSDRDIPNETVQNLVWKHSPPVYCSSTRTSAYYDSCWQILAMFPKLRFLHVIAISKRVFHDINKAVRQAKDQEEWRKYKLLKTIKLEVVNSYDKRQQYKVFYRNQT